MTEVRVPDGEGPERNRQRPQRDCYDLANIILLILAFLAAAAAAIGVFCQAHIFSNELILADGTAKRTSRPYILPIDGNVVFSDKNTSYMATFTLRNTGQTPAYSVSNWAAVRIDAREVSIYEVPVRFGRLEVERTIASTDLGRDVPYIIKRSGTLQPGDFDDLKFGKKALWMWGRIKFDDFFPTSKDRPAEGEHFEEFFARSESPPKITDPWPLIVIRNDVADESMPLDRKP